MARVWVATSIVVSIVIVGLLYPSSATAVGVTATENFNMFYFKRIQNTGTSTITAQGSVLKLENQSTQNAWWTMSDSIAVLSLVQSNLSTGGHILFNAYSGTPTTDGTLYFDGTDLKIRVAGVTYTLTKS